MPSSATLLGLTALAARGLSAAIPDSQGGIKVHGSETPWQPKRNPNTCHVTLADCKAKGQAYYGLYPFAKAGGAHCGCIDTTPQESEVKTAECSVTRGDCLADRSTYYSFIDPKTERGGCNCTRHGSDLPKGIDDHHKRDFADVSDLDKPNTADAKPHAPKYSKSCQVTPAMCKDEGLNFLSMVQSDGTESCGCHDVDMGDEAMENFFHAKDCDVKPSHCTKKDMAYISVQGKLTGDGVCACLSDALDLNKRWGPPVPVAHQPKPHKTSIEARQLPTPVVDQGPSRSGATMPEDDDDEDSSDDDDDGDSSDDDDDATSDVDARSLEEDLNILPVIGPVGSAVQWIPHHTSQSHKASNVARQSSKVLEWGGLPDPHKSHTSTKAALDARRTTPGGMPAGPQLLPPMPHHHTSKSLDARGRAPGGLFGNIFGSLPHHTSKAHSKTHNARAMTPVAQEAASTTWVSTTKTHTVCAESSCEEQTSTPAKTSSVASATGPVWPTVDCDSETACEHTSMAPSTKPSSTRSMFTTHGPPMMTSKAAKSSAMPSESCIPETETVTAMPSCPVCPGMATQPAVVVKTVFVTDLTSDVVMKTVTVTDSASETPSAMPSSSAMSSHGMSSHSASNSGSQSHMSTGVSSKSSSPATSSHSAMKTAVVPLPVMPSSQSASMSASMSSSAQPEDSTSTVWTSTTQTFTLCEETGSCVPYVYTTTAVEPITTSMSMPASNSIVGGTSQPLMPSPYTGGGWNTTSSHASSTSSSSQKPYNKGDQSPTKKPSYPTESAMATSGTGTVVASLGGLAVALVTAVFFL